MVKERISLTLDSEVVDQLDERLEAEGIDNRSRGVEQFLRDYLADETATTAVLLGGGQDSSCLIELNGTPVIQHAVNHLEAAGVENIYITTADPAVRDWAEGRDVEVVFEDEPRGTGGSLRTVAGDVGDTVLVMNGDVLCEVDLSDMYQAHQEGDGIATVALTTVEDASSYGVIQMKGNRIIGFEEKPEESSSHLVNAGVYLLDPAFLDRIPAPGEQEEVDLETLFEQIAAEGQLNGYVYEGEWKEVG
ncbi:MAG: sugar phosphate nucleotidyltransferase [Candidatus Nanohaloarchaea archaeon]|nr:sugar phosphate nucleotidyltransferase [Candidatus Nanohaloarchaea archaeon]